MLQTYVSRYSRACSATAMHAVQQPCMQFVRSQPLQAMLQPCVQCERSQPLQAIIPDPQMAKNLVPQED